MQQGTFPLLLTPVGQRALQAALALAPKEADFLANFQSLSRQYPADLARAALEIAILRIEAQAKFPFAEKLYLTRQAMEQASSYEVSKYRAQRYKHYDLIADLGCSVGSDSFALAKVAPTIGFDRDPLHLEMAQANAKALDLHRRISFIQADLNHSLPFSATSKMALFFDPARRNVERRVFSVHQYQPPLSNIHGWLALYPALGVKISPGVKLNELNGYDAEIEFISLYGELKEAVLWFGGLKTNPRRATLLPAAHSLVGEPDSAKFFSNVTPVSQPLDYIYEPDPAILRAGLVQQLAAQLNANQLDPDIAYLTSEKLIETPFARQWQIDDWCPFQLKRLRSYLRTRNVGRVVVKKRGSPLQPEALIKQLRLQGDQEKVLFLTHLRGKPIVIIASNP